MHQILTSIPINNVMVDFSQLDARPDISVKRDSFEESLPSDMDVIVGYFLD